MEIASLYVDLNDRKNSKHWLDIASEGAPKEYAVPLGWLQLTTLLAEGKRQQAHAILSQFKTVASPDLKLYDNAVVANYFLMDYPETIRQFEQAEALRIKLDITAFSHNSIEANIYASYAYQQLEQFDKSTSLIQQLFAEQERLVKGGGRVTSEHWYQKSLLQSLEGEQKMALITLQRAIDEGWSQPLRISEEPIFQKLKTDNNFQAMLAGLETRMSLMREQLSFEESFAQRWKG